MRLTPHSLYTQFKLSRHCHISCNVVVCKTTTFQLMCSYSDTMRTKINEKLRLLRTKHASLISAVVISTTTTVYMRIFHTECILSLNYSQSTATSLARLWYNKRQHSNWRAVTVIQTDRKLTEIYEQKRMPHFRCCHRFDHTRLTPRDSKLT